MSGATEAVVSTVASSGGSAVMAAMTAAGGVAIAGAVVYLAARKMRSDYCAALTEYQTRSDREALVHASQNLAFIAAQNKAREMSLSLSERAKEDPNTAFFLGGLGRLKTQIRGLDDPLGGPSNGAALLAAQCDALLTQVVAGEATAQFAAYEKLSQTVSQLLTQLKTKNAPQSERAEVALGLARNEVAALRSDIADSVLSEKRHAPTHTELIKRLDQLEQLIANQPLAALQSLGLLRDRVRGELRAAAQNAARETRNAARMRELVGQISAHSQAVLAQDILVAPKRNAETLLKKVATLVTVTPIELVALEALAAEAQNLFISTEKALEEQAMADYLENQVAQVLGSLGYRVTSASNGEESQKMVAVLDSGLGVQLNIDGQGHLSGEMVAFNQESADVNFVAQEKVCNLMDDIFDGLRRRNLVVREKKRKNFKVGSERVKVVQRDGVASENVAAVEAVKALELRVESGR